MKIRLDFVTNSSSSSFVVTIKKSNPLLLEAIEKDKLKEYIYDQEWLMERFCKGGRKEFQQLYNENLNKTYYWLADNGKGYEFREDEDHCNLLEIIESLGGNVENYRRIG